MSCSQPRFAFPEAAGAHGTLLQKTSASIKIVQNVQLANTRMCLKVDAYNSNGNLKVTPCDFQGSSVHIEQVCRSTVIDEQQHEIHHCCASSDSSWSCGMVLWNELKNYLKTWELEHVHNKHESSAQLTTLHFAYKANRKLYAWIWMLLVDPHGRCSAIAFLARWLRTYDDLRFHKTLSSKVEESLSPLTVFIRSRRKRLLRMSGREGLYGTENRYNQNK